MTATAKPAARRRQKIAVSAPVTYSRAPSAVDHLDTAEVLEQLPTLANWPPVTGSSHHVDRRVTAYPAVAQHV